jgi:hypothetical protein
MKQHYDEFDEGVKRYNGNFKVKSFSGWHHLFPPTSMSYDEAKNECESAKAMSTRSVGSKDSELPEQ